MHETVTFLGNSTTRADFIYDGSPRSGDDLLASGASSYMGGFVKVAREHADVELVGLTSPMFPRTYTGSGWITRDAYEHFLGGILRELATQGPFDGVYLALHGAMGVKGVDRPEADIAARIRALIGEGPVIAATFDPHGNEDGAFLHAADLAFCAKYYPHYDEHLQGERAARTLVRGIRGDYRPAHATCRVPILTPTLVQCTDSGPWAELVHRALVWEARRPDLYVNVFFGFPWCDAIDAGMTIQAVANGDLELARTAAADLAAYAWRRRGDLVRGADVMPIPEGLKEAQRLSRWGPVVVADHSDRSGRATWLLREVVDQDLAGVIVAGLTDARLAGKVEQFGLRPGDRIDVCVGGGRESSDGPPVRIVGRLRAVLDVEHLEAHRGTSPWVLVEFGRGNLLVATPYLTQIIDPSVLTEALGLDLQAFPIIALKSRVHFRRGFVDSAFGAQVVVVEPRDPFLGTVRLQALKYRKLRLADYYPYGRETYEVTFQ